MSKINLDENQTTFDIFNRYVFYYGKYLKEERRIGFWASSDKTVYIGIVIGLWIFRVSFWIHREKLNV